MRDSSFAAVIRSNQGKSLPWKNGHGSTREIAIEPKDADFVKNSFVWRLSCAHLKEPGEFSLFPGYERLLSLVEGREIILDINYHQEMATLKVGEVFSFSGDDHTSFALPKGQARDVGLFIKRGFATGEMKAVPFVKKVRSFAFRTKATFLFVQSGSFHANVYPGESDFVLMTNDCLRIDSLDQSERLVVCEPKIERGLLLAIQVNW